jgi:membrane protein implicated in regulation of membrane protease activity
MAVLMAKVGSEFTSQKSGHTGIIAEIVSKENGNYLVRFEDGRWTTVS